MNDSSRLSSREQKDSLSDRQASTSTSVSSFVDVKDLVKIDDTTVLAISFKLSSWREKADSDWEILIVTVLACVTRKVLGKEVLGHLDGVEQYYRWW